MTKKVIASGRLFDGNQRDLDKIIRETNRALMKISIPPTEVKLGKSWGEEVTLGTPSPRKIRCWSFIIRGSLPVVKGVLIHGVVEESSKKNSNQVYNYAKDKKVDYRDLASGPIPCCECSGKSRGRAYIISRNGNDPEQIGENCLQEIIGFNPDKALKMMAIYQSLEKSLYGIKGEKGLTSKITDDTQLSLKEFMQHTLCSVEKKGYVTQKDGAMPTGQSSMLAYLNGPQLAYSGSMFSQLWGSYESYKNTFDESQKRAEDIIEWSRSIPGDTKNTYLANIKKIADDGWVSIKHCNLASSMYHAYESRKYEAVQKNHLTANRTKNPVDGPKSLHLKCASIRKVKTKFGERFLHELYSKEGSAFGLFFKEKTMTPGKFYNIIADYNDENKESKMSSNLTILRDVRKIETTTLDSPPPLINTCADNRYEP